MKTVLITGANRGIGLEFARQYLAEGWHVLAACRDPRRADDLRGVPQGAGRLDILKLDLSETSSFDSFAAEARSLAQKLDLLVNNAGILPEHGDSDGLAPESLTDAFRVNTVGPVFLTRSLVPLLELAAPGALVVNISSTMGSIHSKEGEGPHGDYAYSISKTALNMATRLLANDLREKGIAVVAQCPGWVRTSMGGESATLSPAEAVTALRKTFAAVRIEDSGRFQDRHGRLIDY